MSGGSAITEELRSAIGRESSPYTFEVEKGDIARYAEAIGDPNPLYSDEATARKLPSGGIIAPPTYLIVMRILEGRAAAEIKPPIPFKRSVDGGSEWRYFDRIRPGDRLTATKKIADLYERNGSFGQMLFLVSEIAYRNQFDEVVALQRDTAIYY